MAANGNKEGRDAHGKFIPGWVGGPGRPKGISFRRLVTDVEGQGGLAKALTEVFVALRQQALKGDVQAAKILIDKLSLPESIDFADEALPVDDVVAEVEQMLQAAAARRDAAKKKGKPS